MEKSLVKKVAQGRIPPKRGHLGSSNVFFYKPETSKNASGYLLISKVFGKKSHSVEKDPKSHFNSWKHKKIMVYGENRTHALRVQKIEQMNKL